MRGLFGLFVGMSAVLSLISMASAQPCGGEFGMIPQHAVTGRIDAIVPISGQEAIVVGSFHAFPNPGPTNLARVNLATGALSSLRGVPTGFARTIHPHPSGDVIVSGSFEGHGLFRYVPASGVWTPIGDRLHYLDLTSLLVLPNGDMLLGGTMFFERSGQRCSIVRVSASTGQLTPEVFGEQNVRTLALVGTDVIVAGTFSSIGGVAATNIARYDPVSRVFSPLPGTMPPAIASVGIGAAVVLRDSEGLLVTLANGSNTEHAMYRYIFSTGAWNASALRFAGTISGLTLLPTSGDVIVTGDFGTSPGRTPVVFARYRPSIDFWYPITGWSRGHIRAAAVISGSENQMLAVGEFTHAGSVPAYNIARYDLAQDQWAALTPALESPIVALAATPRSTVIGASEFTISGGDERGPVVEYNPASRTWTGLTSPAIPPFENGFRLGSVAVETNSDVLLSGSQGTFFAGSPFLLRRSATSGQWSEVLSLGDTLTNTVTGLLVRSNGDLIAQGSFHAPQSNGIGSPTVRINRNTGLWSPLSSGLADRVRRFVELPGGTILAVGALRNAGMLAASGVALYRPSTGWSPIGLGINNTVFDALRLPSGDILFGGNFDTADGENSRFLAMLRADLETWVPLGNLFGSPNGGVRALAQLPDGDVLVAGEFPDFPGVPGSRNIARFNPETRAFASLGLNAPGVVTNALVLQNGTIVISGLSFAGFGGPAPVPYIAQYVPTARCDADFDCSRTVDAADLLGFIAAWFSGDPRVDLNASGAADVSDVFQFLNDWFAGCA